MNISHIDQLYDWSHSDNLSTRFWQGVDLIDTRTVISLSEVLLSARVVVGREYLQLTDILYQYKRSGSWTDRQRRSVVMFILAYWRDIDWRLE